MEHVPINIIIDDAADLDRVLEHVQRAGLQQAKVMRNIRTISGVAPSSLLQAIEAVPGVTALERDRSISIPPPDNTLQ